MRDRWREHAGCRHAGNSAALPGRRQSPAKPQIDPETGSWGGWHCQRSEFARPRACFARLRPDAPAHEIAEYCVAYVLRDQRNLRFHDDKATQNAWQQKAPRRTPDTCVGVLGLGHIGSRTAHYFAALGFRVIGWSRSPKTIEGVDCRHGDAALAELLPDCDYIASVLPSTPNTRDLFDADRLSSLKPGAVLINVGRGDLIVEEDLISALDAGSLGGAVLDVLPQGTASSRPSILAQ